MIAIFTWSINSGLPMGLRQARESLRGVSGDECDVSAAGQPRTSSRSERQRRKGIRKLLTKKTLGVLVDQNSASWNHLGIWLRRLGALRVAA
jgi:hypothetical protein